MEDLVFPQPIKFQVTASPLLGGYFFDELNKDIDNSRSVIYSIQYQWKWNIHQRHSKVQRLGSSILRAKKRGVEVFVILNMESPRRNLSKINSVTSNYLGGSGIQTKLLKTSSLIHTKLWIIDHNLTYLGSHNISGRSLSVNEESSVKIESSEFAGYMQKYFKNLWELR